MVSEVRQRKPATAAAAPEPILDASEQEAIVAELEKQAEVAGYYWNKLSSLLLLACTIYFAVGDIPSLPPLGHLVAKAIVTLSLLCSAFLSFSPTSIPFATSHLESGGPVLLLGLLSSTSPALTGRAKLIWMVPSLLIALAYLARNESDTLQRQVGDLKNKMYHSPTA